MVHGHSQNAAQGHSPAWTDKVSSLSALGGLALAAYQSFKDLTPGLIGLTVALVLLAAVTPIRAAANRIRTRRVAKEKSRADALVREQAAIIIGKALVIARDQLSGDSGRSNTVMYGINSIGNYLERPASVEVRLCCDVLNSLCGFFRFLPTAVTPEQAEPVAVILQGALASVIDAFPLYSSKIESAIVAQERPLATRALEELSVLRERANQMIDEYNLLAREARGLGVDWLKEFDTSKKLRASPATSFLAGR